jgi:Kef-type K+ transport system membrane component KefB
VESFFLRDVGICICVSTALAVLAVFLGQPLVIAYLAAGILLGANGLDLIQNQESIAVISEIGLILLMFILGQEINLSRLARSGRVVLASGVVQVVGCFIFGWFLFGIVGLGFGGDQAFPFDRLYLSAAFSLSSTMVVIKILSDRFDLDTLVSRITVGILVIQDLCVIGFLSLQPSLLNPAPADLLWSLTKGLILVGGVFGSARFMLPSIFRRIIHQPEMVLLVAMGWCFAVAGASERLGLSKEMGSLIAGISIATFPFHMDVAAKLSSLRDFFITLFFVALGLQIPIPTPKMMQLAVIVSLFLGVSRFVTISPVLYFLGMGIRGSLIPSINLAQLSEFAPVVLGLGVQLHHVHPSALTLVLLVLLITMVTSSYTIIHAHEISEIMGKVLRLFGLRDVGAIASEKKEKQKPEVVLLGFFRDGSSFLTEFVNNERQANVHRRLFVLDYNPVSHRKLQALGVPSVYGDVKSLEILFKLDLSELQAVLCTIPDSTLRGISNLQILTILRHKLPNAKLVLTADTFEQVRELYENGADYVYLPRLFGAKGLYAAYQAIRAGDVAKLRSAQEEELRARSEILP